MANIAIETYSSDARLTSLNEALSNAPTTGQSFLSYLNSVVIDGFESAFDSAGTEVATRYLSNSMVAPNVLRIQTVNYTLDLTGTFSNYGSSVSKISIFDKASGALFNAEGEFRYVGLPIVTSAYVGSTMTQVSAAGPTSVPGFTTVVAMLNVQLTLNSSGWQGQMTSYVESLFDYAGNQVGTILQSDARINSISGDIALENGRISSYSNYFTEPDGTTITEIAVATDISPNLSSVYLNNPWDAILSGDDTIHLEGPGALPAIGGGGNDLIFNSQADSSIYGGSGTDTLVQSGSRSSYSIVAIENVDGTTDYQIQDERGVEGVDLTSSVEVFRFSDMTVNLNSAATSRSLDPESLRTLEELYVAFFNRIPDADGLAYWATQVKLGVGINQIADSFYSAAIQYSSITGYSEAMSSSDFVRVIYKNVLGRAGDTAPPDEDVQYWANELSAGNATKGALVTTMLWAAHTFKGNPTWGWVADLLDNKISVADHFAVQQGLNYNTPADSISYGMEIAAAVTPNSTAAAISLIGVSDQALV